MSVVRKKGVRRRARWLLLFAAVVFGAAGAAGWLVFTNLPDARVPAIPGLAAPVVVSFDDRGVALVTASSIGDALRAQGYVTARERMFQIELLRRSSSGDLSALFGKAALELDRVHRTYGFSRVAAAAVPLLPEDERASLVALADGINAFIDSHRGRWGVEFKLLGARPRPFTPADSLLILLAMHEDLSTHWRAEIQEGELAKLPPSLQAFLTPRATRDDVTLVPDAAPLSSPPLPDVAPGALSMGVAPSDARDESEREIGGSNAWAVSGALTVSGKPMLANDPHLGITMPALWLPMRFSIGGRPVEGVTLPGLPGVILGRNAAVAWGYTNLMADVEDVYREEIVGNQVRRGGALEPIASRDEVIEVRGGPPVRLRVRETSHGPLVTDEYALKWAALDPRNLRLPTAVAMLAASPAELQAALDRYDGPAQNVVWAARDGSIGWRAAGLVPIRRPGTDGSVPYDGRDPENDWRGYVPMAEMPRIVDPPSGYVVTANQRVIGTSYPYLVATDWASPTRARRIRDLLEEAKKSGRKLDRAALEAIQMDVVSEPLRTLVLAFLPHLPADLASLLEKWDGAARPDGPEPLVARALRRTLRERALAAWGVKGWSRFSDEETWNDLLSADAEAWKRTGLPARDAFLADVAKRTLDDLTARYGERKSWRWGEANRLAARHPLGRVPGLSWLFDPPFRPQSGYGGVVKASSPEYGQSMRFVLDWNDPEAATLVVPFGVSGHLGSPHRFDQLTAWLGGDPTGAATRLDRPATGAALELLPPGPAKK